MKKIYLSLVCCFSILLSFSQIVVDNSSPNNSPIFLIDNILLGGGISAFNHVFQGDSSQIGFFSGVSSNLGIDSGIVLSSGNVLELVGPNASGSTSTSFSGTGDPTLDIVVGPIDYTNDAAVLEFDFIPTSDSISFKYVFGSEEYLEFVTSFNDAFGFFLSGPNPAGGMYVDENLAIIPGTTNTPVSIFNVNNVSNSTYYVDNGDGFTAPQNTDSTVIQFDGFTTPLTATAAVNCGDTYHIKLVVADVNDFIYDSGVFLEAGSFSSAEPGAISIQVNTSDVMCNGDSSGTATIFCVYGATPPYTINWNGQNPNALLAGNYTVNITDANGIISAQSYVINGPTAILTTISQPSFDLESNTMGGTPSYTYQWLFLGSIVGTNVNYTPMQNGDYMIVITDANGCIDSSDVYSVTNIPSSISEYLTNKLMIYPNPFTQNTTINLVNPHDVLLSVSLYDPTGKKVKDFNISKQKQSIVLEKGNLAEGMYMLVVQTNNYISKSKLVIR